MQKARYIIAIVIAVAVVLGVGVGVWWIYFRPPLIAEVKIGFLGPLTGPFAHWGEMYLEGMRIAVKEINEAGGVLGAPIRLIEMDTKNDIKEAVTAFRRLVEVEKVSAIGGPVSSDIGIATGAEAERLKVPLLLNMAGSERILTKLSRYTFRTALMSAPMQIHGEAMFIKKKGIKRVAAIIADYAWGRSVEKAIYEYIAPIPGITLRVEVAPVLEKDFTPYLKKLAPMDYELMIASGHPPGCLLIHKQQLELGLTPKYHIGPYFSPSLWWKVLGEGVFKGAIDWAYYDPLHPEFVKFVRKVVKEYGVPFDVARDHNFHTGYHTIQLISEAIKKAGSSDPKAVRDAISKMYYKPPHFIRPWAWTEWGEIKEGRLGIIEFKPGPPPGLEDLAPEAKWHTRLIFVSDIIPPFVPPEKW